MSIGVGTLQPKSRVMRPVWLAGLIAIIAVFAMSVMGANSIDVSRRSVAVVGRTNANTPTELSGGIVGYRYAGIALNTPTELRGGVAGSFTDTTFEAVPHLPRRNAEAESFGGTAANTPTELRGGIVCHQCR